MSFSALPASLPSLSNHEAIADALYRAVLAFDHGDEELLRSAVTDDITAEMPGSPPTSGIAALKASVFDRVAFGIDTTHFLSNIRVNLASASATTAQVSCSALAQHVRKGKGYEPGNKFTSGCMYLCDVIKEESSSLWKIENWKIHIIWVDGDRSVMTGQ
ncbi:hypothetical protein JX265_003296 [Neoarthrinium moseri]|uniref:SnoaL-like domain-containing protein n=1 Tax=Neoarthrinium moseri TaxID=1658444 RepID=A0A9P9WTL9_9PEZI|nr:uncharacterized protein JN550_005461 [Neoarthrinium moseri]KAI1852812.1 hypothetical protein JX266_002353 [Neoarthrinium moseri]KAI1869871.1 hypothetical protein JN550_005461 [Neoarthrinium moseri]KAI1879119.1 hypothetical protein JX265_003296 [Neoarthrinium moseri]